MQPSQPTRAAPDLRVEGELVRLAYQDLTLGLLATCLVALAIAWVVAPTHEAALVWGWLAGMVALSVVRYFNIRRFKSRRRDDADAAAWAGWFVAGAVTSGLGWGAAGWFFYPHLPPTASAFLIFCLSGMTAGATRSLSPLVRACWMFQIFAQLPLVTQFFLSGESIQYLMGGLSIVYLTLLLAMARSFQQTLTSSLRNGFAHADVVTTLTSEQERTQQLNRDLRAENEHRQRIEVELREARDRAENESHAKSEFLATMSHEILTPMNGVMGMLELLKGTPLSPPQREQVDTAASSAENLLRMLNDILAFSKMETGQMDLEATPFLPQKLIEEVVELMRPRASAKSVALLLQAESASDARVLGDATRFRQVVLNLVSNAIKFTPQGSVELTLITSPEPGRKLRIILEVCDTGPGLSEDMRAKLFEPFSQADSSMSRRHGGAGLGLAISQKLMQRMGGKISVESRSSQGSRFTLTLVLPVAGGSTKATPLSLGSTEPLLFQGRILVVEDDRVNQRVITLMLERLGLQCHVVENGLTALEVLRQGTWDLVFMDCQLPGLNGFETTRQAIALLGDRTPPIIALTANVRPEDREACRAAGMADFLGKPVRVDGLRACLSRWLNQNG
jgi:two-component system, sensor histidine kinase